jgi:hypothetical protein
VSIERSLCVAWLPIIKEPLIEQECSDLRYFAALPLVRELRGKLRKDVCRKEFR